ncbi:hypothetical protein, partial [Streptomyces violaceusniger]|uniref:hypothetical protein n=1 Tax=Streptomyces violaceusniger TaxID=68280 RepID=UPI001BDEEBA9
MEPNKVPLGARPVREPMSIDRASNVIRPPALRQRGRADHPSFSVVSQCCPARRFRVANAAAAPVPASRALREMI